MKTDRIGFLRSLLIVAMAPSVLVPKFGDTHKWKQTANLWVPNPEWENADYKISFAFNKGILDSTDYGTWVTNYYGTGLHLLTCKTLVQ